MMRQYRCRMATEKFQRAKSRAGMRTTTVTLPLPLHRRLLHAAVEDNMPLTELMRRVLKGWLAQRRKRGGSR
jgi:hypothetical protein